jgi:hypothetical protein
MANCRFPRVFLAVCALAGWSISAGAVAAEPSPADSSAVEPGLLGAERDAVAWIMSQMTPNEAVQAPDPGRRRLLLSYRVPRTDPAYPYVYGRSFVYDDALGAIALTMAKEYRAAEFVLGALKRLVREDGSLWFAYNTQNDWPGEADHEGALIRSGAVAWVGYAFTHYLESKIREDSSFLRGDPLASEFVNAAESIAGYLLANRVTDGADVRYGFVTGGTGAHTLTATDGAPGPIEVYSGARLRWVSMEHNIDAYFFLRDLGRVTGNKLYADAAELIGRRLMTLWSDADGQFVQGIHESGALDTELPLDGASWGALFLLSLGDGTNARRCIDAMELRFHARSGSAAGYRPYASKPVYDDERVNRYFFPRNPKMRWQDLDFVWGEGSLGAAAALIRAGDRAKGTAAIVSLSALREGGGIRYASATVPYQFGDYPSVASTAWFVIAVEILKGGREGDAFWGK